MREMTLLITGCSVSECSASEHSASDSMCLIIIVIHDVNRHEVMQLLLLFVWIITTKQFLIFALISNIVAMRTLSVSLKDFFEKLDFSY